VASTRSVCQTLEATFHTLIQKRLPAAIDHVIDRAVVLEGVAARDVVVVGIPIAPDEPGALIAFAGHGLELHREVDILGRDAIVDSHRKAIVRGISVGLRQHVPVRRIVSLDNPDARFPLPRERE